MAKKIYTNTQTLGNGAATLNQYGAGNFTGTPTYNLSVDVDGNIIEELGATGTFTSQDGKTITVTNGLITSIV